MVFEVNVPSALPAVYDPSSNQPFQLIVFPFNVPPEYTVYVPPSLMPGEEKKTDILFMVLGNSYLSIMLPSESTITNSSPVLALTPL